MSNTNNVWSTHLQNELGRLVQGVGKMFKGTDTIFYVAYENIPSQCRKFITYGGILVDYNEH